MVATSASSFASENGWPSRVRRFATNSVNGTVALPAILERRDARLLAAVHGKGDDQLAISHLACVRGDRLPVSLRAQVLLDPAGRILEQIFVDRPFALDRHQLGPAIGWQRSPANTTRTSGPGLTVIVILATRSSFASSTAGVILAS
jgi:hypothetical protein